MNIIIAFFCLLPYRYELSCNEQQIVVDAIKVDFQDYVPLKSITDLIDINYVLDNTTQRLCLTSEKHIMEIVGNISTITINNMPRNLPFPPLYINNDIYFPVNEVIPILGGTFEKLIFMKEIKEVPPIESISFSARGDSTVLSFNWERSVDFDVQFFLNSVVVELDGQFKKKDNLKPTGSVSSIKLEPFNTYTRLEFDIKDVNAYLERDKEVVFYHKITERIGLIVIDPGHGGVDPGAVGKKGLYEKDANLEISSVLAALIGDSLKVKVIMTRDKDIYLSLKERTNIANRNSADLFISVHCNASGKSKEMKGFETYFLSEARTTEARAVAARENASLKFDGIEPTDELTYILYDLAQSAFLEESNHFAECIQDQAAGQLEIPSRGVKQAGFYVLRGAFMPAILVECAFVSNLDEEALLKKKSFRQKLASSLFAGIRDYILSYERRANN